MYKFCRIIFPGALINNAIDNKTVKRTDVRVYSESLRMLYSFYVVESQMNVRGCSTLESPLQLEVGGLRTLQSPQTSTTVYIYIYNIVGHKVHIFR